MNLPRVLPAIFYFLSCVILSGCVTTEYNPGSHSQDLIMYSTESEIAMGANIAREIKQEMKVSYSPLDIRRVNSIGDKIAAVCDRTELNYYFYVISEEKEKNAFSLPGGYIYIFKGLLDVLNDDELAFVLAHEVAHVVSRHAIKKLQASMGATLVLIGTAASPGSGMETAQGLSLAIGQAMAAYSREDEFNADELAVKYLRLIGYKPEMGIEVMEKLYREEKKMITPIDYFRTHPYVPQRIRHIKEALHLPLSPTDYVN